MLSVLLSFLAKLDCHSEEAGFDPQLSPLVAPEFLLNFSSWDFTKIPVVRDRSKLPSTEVSRPTQRAVSQQDSFRGWTQFAFSKQQKLHMYVRSFFLSTFGIITILHTRFLM